MTRRLTDKQYSFIYSHAPRTCIDLLIIQDGKFLCFKRDTKPYKGRFNLPGGAIRFGETIQQAAQRIALRELGVPVLLLDVEGTIEFTNERVDWGRQHSVSIVIQAKVLKGERTGGEWKTGNEKNFHPIHKKWLKDKGWI